MLKDRKELKEFYNGLNKAYEGYIQLSDKRIEHVFKKPNHLPKWDDIHNGINYILEMALFEPTTKRSILVRQHNSGWLVLDEVVDDSMPEEYYFTVMSEPEQMKVVQVWEDVENKFCLDMEVMKVMEPKYLLFAGFCEKGDS